MGLFSFFKRDENYEQILSTLEQEIRRSEAQRLACIARIDWWANNWLFYMSVTWVAYLAGFVFYVWPERYGRQAPVFLVHLVSVILIPVFVYYGALGIRSVGQRIVSRHDRKIVNLRKELKERLDELKKKTAFDTTKTLIDRYSAGGSAKPGAVEEDAVLKPGVQQQNATAKLKQQQILDAKNRRRTMPNFSSPGSRATTGAAVSVPTSPDPVSNLHGPPAQPQRNPSQMMGDRAAEPSGVNRGLAQQQQPPHFALPETGVVKVPQHGGGAGGRQSGQPNAASTTTGASRPWLDKLVDQLVGDSSGVDEKYALICRHCYAHNGLVLVDEINDIQYNCPKCGKFNPSNRAIRAASAVQLADFQTTVGPQQPKSHSRSVEHSDQDESGTTHPRRGKSVRSTQYTADDSASDSGAGSDASKSSQRSRRPGRAARDSAQPMSAVTSDTDVHDLRPQRPKPRQQQPRVEGPPPAPPAAAQQQKQQKITPKKRKSAKSKRSL
ncbi:hypothetical protein GGF42_000693 [Coemansia sp. RSA 2424]|nr:hypothetical protein GGF42_000693 [Coemansia sp. RSA 2424]